MAVDIETIGIGFDTSGLNKGQRALKDTEQAANKTANAADKTSNSFSALSSAVKAAAAALAVLGVAAVAREFVQAADAVALMNARLKLATGGGLEFAQAQQAVYRIAQANNVGLEEAATLYTKLAEPIRNLGGGTAETAAIVDAFATSLRISGASSAEASAATLQFAQAMASGKLSGDEFRSMAETSPRFMKALADGLGVPTGALKEMAANGELTAGVVGNALTAALGKLKGEAAGLPDTVGGAFARIKNDWLLAVDEINKQSGLTGGLTGVLEVARKLIPTIKDELVGAFQSVGAWIDNSREGLGEIWDATKGIISDAWEIAKGASSVLGFVVELVVQTGIFKTILESARLILAGFQDGVKIIGAAFAALGSMIIKTVLSPLQLVFTASAKIAGVFNEDLAAKINGINAQISDFANAGTRYGAEVATAFGNGDSAVGRLAASLGEAKTATESAKKAAEDASKTYAKLGGGSSGKGAEDSKARAKALKAEADAAKKAFDEYAKLFDRLMEGRNTLREQTAEMREYNERIGLSKEAIAELDAQKLEGMAISKEENAILAETVDLTGEMSRLYREQAAELRKQANLKREGSAKETAVDEQRKIAEESQKVWENFTENVQRNLGDGLYDAMNGNFKSIGQAFKSMLTRMAADAMAADIMSLMTGKKSSGGGYSGLSTIIGAIGSAFGGSGGSVNPGVGANGWVDWSSTPVPSANGNVFSSGSLMTFADGGAFTNGIVSRPTKFNIGLMGEAGPEAIMPLTRGPDGSLGVKAQGGGGKSVQITYAPSINIDSRADRNDIYANVQRMLQADKAELMDRMERERI